MSNEHRKNNFNLNQSLKKGKLNDNEKEFFNHDINRFLNGNIQCCTPPYALRTMYKGISRAIRLSGSRDLHSLIPFLEK